MEIKNWILAVAGTWLFSDGIYSIILYFNKCGYDGTIQTWRKDHWIRALRMLLGVIITLLALLP